jgi:hypothetical protein
LLGSNFATPTIEITAAKGTDIIEPPLGTQKVIEYLTNNF